MGLRGFLVAGTSLALCGFGSCTVSVKDLCGQKLPEFTQSVQSTLQDLSPKRAGRSLASIDPGAKPVERTLWAEERLVEVQRYRDAMEGEGAFSAVRDLLSKIADDLVAFHGYAQKDHSERTNEKMRVMLRKMESKTEKLRRQVCIPPL